MRNCQLIGIFVIKTTVLVWVANTSVGADCIYIYIQYMCTLWIECQLTVSLLINRFSSWYVLYQ